MMTFAGLRLGPKMRRVQGTLKGVHMGRHFRPRVYYGWVLASTLGVTTMISYGTSWFLFSVLVVPMGHDLGWDRASMSGAFSIGIIVAGLLGVPVGRLLDRYGARLFASLGSAIAGVTLMGLAHVQTLGQFYVLWSLGFGISNALTFYPVSTTAVANWFERRRGTALLWLTLFGGLGLPIFIPLAGFLIPHVGWRETLQIFALINLVVALPLHALIVRRRPEDLGLLPDGQRAGETRPDDGHIELHGLGLQQAFRTPAFWIFTASFATARMAWALVAAHQVAQLIALGYAGEVAASAAGAVGLSQLLGRLFLNVFHDRLPPQRLLAFVMFAQAVGVLFLLHARTLPWLVLYVALYGAAAGGMAPLQASTVGAHFGRRAFGAITAAQGLAINFMMGSGPVVGGWLFDATGNYTLAFAVCIIAFCVGGVGALLAPRAPQATLQTD